MIFVMSRVVNSPAAITAWEQRAAARLSYRYNTTYHDDGFRGSVGQPFVYLVDDVFPKGPIALPTLGRDVTSRAVHRASLAAIVASTRTLNVSTAGQAVFVGALEFLPSANATALVMYSTVFDDDPLRSLLWSVHYAVLAVVTDLRRSPGCQASVLRSLVCVPI